MVPFFPTALSPAPSCSRVFMIISYLDTASSPTILTALVVVAQSMFPTRVHGGSRPTTYPRLDK